MPAITSRKVIPIALGTLVVLVVAWRMSSYGGTADESDEPLAAPVDRTVPAWIPLPSHYEPLLCSDVPPRCRHKAYGEPFPDNDHGWLLLRPDVYSALLALGPFEHERIDVRLEDHDRPYVRVSALRPPPSGPLPPLFADPVAPGQPLVSPQAMSTLKRFGVECAPAWDFVPK